MRKLLIVFTAVFLVISMVGIASAIPTYVGYYRVTDGPLFSDNPPVYSALEAAVLNFGPTAGFYEISTAGPDPNLINNLGWYARIGIGPGTFAESYSKDTGPSVGYNGPGWSPDSDISAWVGDHFPDDPGGEGGYNYVFETVAAVPEPATMLLLGSGLFGLAFFRKKKEGMS